MLSKRIRCCQAHPLASARKPSNLIPLLPLLHSWHCRVDGAPELGLALTLTGACCATTAQPEAVAFRCNVRGSAAETVTITNPTGVAWQLRPIIQNDFWSGPEFLRVGGGPGLWGFEELKHCDLGDDAPGGAGQAGVDQMWKPSDLRKPVHAQPQPPTPTTGVRNQRPTPIAGTGRRPRRLPPDLPSPHNDAAGGPPRGQRVFPHPGWQRPAVRAGWTGGTIPRGPPRVRRANQPWPCLLSLSRRFAQLS
jgi:hypothetical protein